METSILVEPSSMSVIMSILSLGILAIGIYLTFLLIKALRIYIKRNS